MTFKKSHTPWNKKPEIPKSPTKTEVGIFNFITPRQMIFGLTGAALITGAVSFALGQRSYAPEIKTLQTEVHRLETYETMATSRPSELMYERDTNPWLKAKYGPHGINPSFPGSLKYMRDSQFQGVELVRDLHGLDHLVLNAEEKPEQKIVVTSLQVPDMPNEAKGINGFIYTNDTGLHSLLDQKTGKEIPLDPSTTAFSPWFDVFMAKKSAEQQND
jgi:hypothetical protein